MAKYEVKDGGGIIPEWATEIEAGAFSECEDLREVVIPQWVRKIGEDAFYECRNLKSVELPEWLEEMARDFNHPALVGWCPFNETWDQNGRKQVDEALALVYQATKAADPTRPCIDTSGNYHVVTDVYDVHDYEQDPAKFAEHFADYNEFGTMSNGIGKRQHYSGKEPFFVSEYGGIRWSEDPSGWGYGNAPKTEEEFKARFKGLTDILLDNENIFGLCYTQLYDVEQEQNGLYPYDRRPKFENMRDFYDIMSRKAAIED